jgi:hypothetical protein
MTIKFKGFRIFPSLLIFLISFSMNSAIAQQSEFDQLFNELKGSIKTVQTGNYTYESELTFVNTSVIKYRYTKTSNKGSAVTYEYELNFADIDPYTVRENTEKDLILVAVKIKNSQKLVKKYQDNIVKAYVSELEFVASDIDNGRKIRKLIEDAIPIGEKIMTNKLSLNGYGEMLSWLEGNIKPAVYEDKSFEQSLIRDEKYAGKVNLKIVETGSSAKEHGYSFNLADINVNTLKFTISGSQFGLEFETIRKHHLIKYVLNGDPKPFIYRIEIKANNVEEARDLRRVMELIIEEAKIQVEASFPKFTDQQQALNAVSE